LGFGVRKPLIKGRGGNVRGVPGGGKRGGEKSIRRKRSRVTRRGSSRSAQGLNFSAKGGEILSVKKIMYCPDEQKRGGVKKTPV